MCCCVYGVDSVVLLLIYCELVLWYGVCFDEDLVMVVVFDVVV